MNIIFTGASSFTGYWFIKTLAGAGHNITAVFTQNNINAYEGIRRKRIEEISKICTTVYKCEFGNEKFLNLISEKRFNLLCHHAADVKNYKSADFNVANAIKSNTYNIRTVLGELKKPDFNGIIISGNVYEQNEGAGTEPLRAFSPYDLSKTLSFDIIHFYAQLLNIKIGKFVIPNPFGPYEEPKFTHSLMKNWAEGKTVTINTPDYIRDNIHIDLLAKTYLHLTDKLVASDEKYQKINPRGYAETQGEFTKRFAGEMHKRLGINCDFILNPQTDFTEPLKRVNIEPADKIIIGWDEEAAWDALAGYYKILFKI